MEINSDYGGKKEKTTKVDMIIDANQRKCPFRFWLLVFLIIMLAGSLYFRYIRFSEERLSIACWLTQKVSCLGSLYTFSCSVLTAEGIKEILKVIGVSSLLIGWLYGVLQKEDSGLYYSELLELLYPRYNQFVLVYVIAYLVGLWQAISGSREGSVLALIVITTYSIPLWRALSFLVFFPVCRRRLVQRCWEAEIDEAFRKKSGAESAVESVYRLIDAISMESPGYRDLLCCFAKALCHLTNNVNKMSDEEYKNLIIHLTSCWEHLLRNRAQGDRNILLREVFLDFRLAQDTKWSDSEVENSSEIKSQALLALGQAYVLWLTEETLKASSGDDQSRMSDLLPRINNDLSITIHSYLHDKEEELVAYITTGYLLIMWFICIFQGISIVDKDRLDGMPLQRKISKKEEVCWKIFLQLSLPWVSNREEKAVFALEQINARVTGSLKTASPETSKQEVGLNT